MCKCIPVIERQDWSLSREWSCVHSLTFLTTFIYISAVLPTYVSWPTPSSDLGAHPFNAIRVFQTVLYEMILIKSPLSDTLFFQCDQDRSIFWAFYLILINIFGLRNYLFLGTRSYCALRAADLDWIVGPGYSSGGYTLGCSQRLASCLRHSARITLLYFDILLYFFPTTLYFSPTLLQFSLTFCSQFHTFDALFQYFLRTFCNFFCTFSSLFLSFFPFFPYSLQN